MKLLTTVILHLLLAESILSAITHIFDKEKPIHFQNCYTNLNTPPAFHLAYIRIHPLPLRYPGKASVSFKFAITKPLPLNLSLELQVEFQMFSKFFFKVPCVDWFGSCNYVNLCHTLQRFTAYNGCPRALKKRDIPCNCPFESGLYKAKHITFKLPRLSYLLRLVLKTKSRITFRLKDGETSEELSCYTMDIEMKEKRKKQKRRRRKRKNTKD